MICDLRYYIISAAFRVSFGEYIFNDDVWCVLSKWSIFQCYFLFRSIDKGAGMVCVPITFSSLPFTIIITLPLLKEPSCPVIWISVPMRPSYIFSPEVILSFMLSSISWRSFIASLSYGDAMSPFKNWGRIMSMCSTLNQVIFDILLIVLE